MKFSLPFILIFAFNAFATLGGKTADAEKDLPLLSHRKLTHIEDPAGCYLVKQINSDGISVKQYINKSTDTVFMVRINSRVMMAIQPLMKAEDFEEYQQAKDRRHVNTLNRRHKSASTETSRLRVMIDDTPMIHRSLMVLKSHVPNCVANLEALP